MPKINWKSLLFFGLLIYSRFIGLGWGLPNPFHPDERNMAIAIQQLNWQDKFNPHFFAYGQFPLYLGYLISWLTKFDATMSLRIISAVASVINALVLFKIIKLFSANRLIRMTWVTWLVIIFSPYAIQFAHFGTTESLLMLFYSLIVYFVLKDSGPLQGKRARMTNIFWLGLFSGLSMATKVSSSIFLVLPAVVILKSSFQKKLTLSSIARSLATLGMTIGVAIFFFILFSPHNFFHLQDFLGSMIYEADVALGKIVVFYTRQFVGTIPIVFQFERVFPYALGFFQFALFLFGFVFLPWKDKQINLLRLAFLAYFLPNAFLFAKWTRFMTPVFPVMTVLAILFAYRVILSGSLSLAKRKLRFTGSLLKALLLLGMTGGIIFSGLSYLTIYQKPDTRIQASNWIYKNIPENSYILSETANVVDIPVGRDTSYQVISFNFYELDNDPILQEELQNHLRVADYIFVPSRRIFANHPKDKHPRLNKYYEDLFSGNPGFKKVAEFSAGLRDEAAEETWTVFDHPVIRIYKRI